MEQKKRFSLRTAVTLTAICVLMPLALFLCFGLGEKNDRLASVLILVLTMLPFFFLFEHRRPQARKLVVLAVMCALSVASRVAFSMLDFFKPTTAIIMIAGIAFGAEEGFLTGAVSALVSNLFFGQGPWTPWQMFAYGMAGFLAGALLHSGPIPKKPLPMAIFGAAAILLIVGPLLDTCSVFTMLSKITPKAVGAVYLAGLPINAIHAVCAFVTLLLIGKPLLGKLERVQRKYGME